MLAFRKILFPVNFSARCVWFAPYLGEVARKFGSEVTLVHALDLYHAFGYRAASRTTFYESCETGRGTPHEFLGRLRTNVGSIVRESPCPVLSA